MSTHIAHIEKSEFNQRFNNYYQQLDRIRIPADVNPATARNILTEIDRLYASIRLDYAFLQSERNRIESIIKELERVEAVGKNETERRKNATDAIRNFEVEEGRTMNLYHMQRQIASRYEMYSSLIDIMDKKQSRLITVSGLLKLDKELQGEHL